MAKSKGGIIKKMFLTALLASIIFVGYWAYENVFKSNVRLDGKKYTYIYIKSNATYNEMLVDVISAELWIRSCVWSDPDLYCGIHL